ncbi:MAG TPA: hypothetical protein VK700_18130 [Steroidobacteraceae bacterium]|jgi:hypothetical protein|nr:hypothetical protein [Steroidobacteraceae bacterium]
MSKRWMRSAARWLLVSFGFAAACAFAEPYIAVQTGLKCSQCHVNPTGGGLRGPYGDVYAQTLMPASKIDTGPDLWTGDVSKFFRIGGDLRTEALATEVPHSKTISQFMLEQARVYLEAQVIPDRLLVYVDEQVAPGGALNREAYVLYWAADHDWYLKAGQLYLPFGWRLQDQTAFVRQASGINMTTPDQGAEFGWLRGHWDAQLDVTNGTAGGTVTDSRKEFTSQLVYVESIWRTGLAANYNDKLGGGRSTFGLFAGLHTGPITWLGEADVIDDKSQGFAQGRMLATLVEANWLISRGNNLKLTAEYLDPNRDLQNNGETRWSVVYELTPIQFAQIRAGVRYYDGIPQSNTQNTRLYFIELHGFF